MLEQEDGKSIQGSAFPIKEKQKTHQVLLVFEWLSYLWGSYNNYTLPETLHTLVTTLMFIAHYFYLKATDIQLK